MESPPRPPRSRRPRKSFNGATANSPWRAPRGSDGGSGRVTASMGPRRIRRGELLGDVLRRPPGPELQWGHGEFAVESAGCRQRRSPGCRSFNGATANSPWRASPFDGGKAAPGDCFNGATANSPWRAGSEAPVLRGVSGFNGATANLPWRATSLTCRWMAAAGLQWGHGEFAVENVGARRSSRRAGERLQWGHGEFAVENVESP